VNQRLTNETAFDMTRVLVGMIAHEVGDEEYRQMFEQVFQTCRASLETYGRELQRMQHQLRPMGGSNVRVPATA